MLTNATGEELALEQAEGKHFNETWVYYPDAPDFNVTGKLGDPRAAVGPALALAALGEDVKWLLYGDVSKIMEGPGCGAG